MNGKCYTGYNPYLKERARQLRRNMTRQERRLWYDFLRNYPVKVYRQRSIDRFIVDFYCHRAHLVIEVDGKHHATPEVMAYDDVRTAILQSYQLTVIRIRNEEIDGNFCGVCKRLDQQIREELSKWEEGFSTKTRE